MIKRILLSALIALSLSGYLLSQTPANGFQFTTVKENKITPVKNQNRSGTCWSFSGVGFLESELIRMGKPVLDLSEMFIVHNCYLGKAEKYVRLHGNLTFAGGGSFHDVLETIREAGMVPESEMKGLNYGETMHVHGEMDEAAASYVKSIVGNKNSKLSPAWKEGFRGIIEAYLGEAPQKFNFEGKEYTPQSFAKFLDLNPDNYVSLTSYTHHPFYGTFALEIPDNWRWGHSYNLPLDEFMQVFDYAIEKGYTIAWGADVSEQGFKNSLARVPAIDPVNLTGSDRARWEGLSEAQKEAEAKKKEENPNAEKVVTQEIRQEAFDNYQTTDDHGMQIYGIAKDQHGTKYYMVKNSWGESGPYKGLLYASETFVKYKTMNIVLHKDALPKEIQKKLGL